MSCEAVSSCSLSTLGLDWYVNIVANSIAATEGDQVLAKGGNAIDAAVVIQFVQNVVEPTLENSLAG